MSFRKLGDSLLHYARPLHKWLRERKVDLFLDFAGNVCGRDRLLDAGGGLGIDEEFVSLYATFSEVFVVNLDTPCFDVPKGLRVIKIAADCRKLPFKSETFDWVFSNAVIEHVGDWKRQKQFADEIRRVAAKGYFVTTPNKFFPIEQHTFWPFYQFLPVQIQRRLVPYSPGYLKQYEEINLLSAKQMQELFPEASVASMGFPVFGNSLVAFYAKSRDQNTRTRPSIVDFTQECLLREGSPRIRMDARDETYNRRQLEDAAQFGVLGVRINAVQTLKVVGQIQKWIRERDGCHSVAAADMHCIVEAQRDPSFKNILNATDMVVPDGMPLVWLGRRKGHILRRRVYGPDLLLAFCEESAGLGYRHFFYGGEPGVAERLAESLKIRFPGLNVVGTCSPPFRSLSAEEDAEMVEMISRAAPDVLWVGLGAPKQEHWMHEHKDRLTVPALVGVGAAFDLLSGRRKQAPRWMREHGFEWFFRLLQEPRRLWRRYLVFGSQFIAYVILDSLRLRNFAASGSRLPKRTPGRQARA
jgi:N-acetylglucosaminyldiphosphoundecaprenol N-acetyl-beta-D-mannosaminyltransferase